MVGGRPLCVRTHAGQRRYAYRLDKKIFQAQRYKKAAQPKWSSGHSYLKMVLLLKQNTRFFFNGRKGMQIADLWMGADIGDQCL